MIGKVVNYRYEVLEKCGDGNFFSVYKARDKVLNRLVAVKVLTGYYSKDSEFAERLISEAQTTTDLSHPNIAKVIEADSQNSDYFVTVEYVRGINLKDRIHRTGPFAVSYAVDIAIAVAQALEYAHRNGVVHGDVRPHNILTSPEGQVKLTDFGMAQALAAFPTIREAAMLRSVHYMAPEVVRGEPPEPSSDIYSLGVALYEMLTGSVPYDGTTSAAIAARQLEDPVPSPQVQNSGVPAVLNEIVMKAMQKDPTQRFASAAELAAALHRVREWLRTGQTPAQQSHHNIPIETPIYVQESEPERGERFAKTAVVMLLAVLAIAVVTAIIVAALTGGLRSNEITVPDLIGKEIDQAREIAERKGLVIQIREDYNDTYPENQVYKTLPEADGTVKKDRPTVVVFVSKGPRLAVVPQLVGLEETEARRKIADSQLMAGQTTPENSETVPVGRVIRQDPPVGTEQPPLTRVNIAVSAGPEASPEEPTTPEEPGYGTPEPTGTETPPPPEDVVEHTYNVGIDLSSKARGPQDVRIEVEDEKGQYTVFDEQRDPGTKVEENVRGFGDHVEIRVYVNDKLIQYQIYSKGKQIKKQVYGN